MEPFIGSRPSLEQDLIEVKESFLATPAVVPGGRWIARPSLRLHPRVVVCSPTTVLATLQMVHHAWRSERQKLNARRASDYLRT